jgi:hypothetical protein
MNQRILSRIFQTGTDNWSRRLGLLNWPLETWPFFLASLSNLQRFDADFQIVESLISEFFKIRQIADTITPHYRPLKVLWDSYYIV